MEISEISAGAFSSAWFLALLSIVIMDLVLAGDNAVAIALAARSLPHKLQRKAILWGTLGAVAIRILMTLLAVYLMQIPGLKLAGGIGLFYIAIKLLQPHEESQHDEHSHQVAATSFTSALKTIIIADALMGLDNVLAIAGAAKDNFTLVILGLLISIPIVVFGSAIVLKLINRFSWIIYIGAGILAYTAASMLFTDHLIAPYLHTIPRLMIHAFEIILALITLLFGWLLYKKSAC